jgi:flagellar motility protein MotE (MotC chaperone)
MRWPLRYRLRVLPIMVVASTMLLGFKVADLASGGKGDVAPDARAQAAAPAPKTASAPQASSASKPEGASAQTGAKPASPPSKSADASPVDPQSLSPSEIGVLQQLSHRRAALDLRASEIDQREVVLQAAEKRIDEKIAKLEALQKSIAAEVQKRGAEENARLQGLVKIYEVMKPKDAAQIFDQLSMPVLLSVMKRMKALKTAPILAAMDPAKAKAVTTALAERSDDTGAAPAPAPTPAGATASNP